MVFSKTYWAACRDVYVVGSSGGACAGKLSALWQRTITGSFAHLGHTD